MSMSFSYLKVELYKIHSAASCKQIAPIYRSTERSPEFMPKTHDVAMEGSGGGKKLPKKKVFTQ